MQLTLEEIFGKWDGFEYKERRQKSYKLVYGIGTNDSPFQVMPTKQTRHPAYICWSNMLLRASAYSGYRDKYPTYFNVTCCEDWLLFTNFAKWFKDNYIKDCQLDKDLLCKDNKIYSPKTCLFIPQEINKFLTLSSKARGLYSIGVHKKSTTSSFSSQIDSNNTKKHLGYFDTQEEAHKAWQKAKLEQAIAFNFPPLQRIIDQLKFEIENNLETTSL